MRLRRRSRTLGIVRILLGFPDPSANSYPNRNPTGKARSTCRGLSRGENLERVGPQRSGVRSWDALGLLPNQGLSGPTLSCHDLDPDPKPASKADPGYQLTLEPTEVESGAVSTHSGDSFRSLIPTLSVFRVLFYPISLCPFFLTSVGVFFACFAFDFLSSRYIMK